jgi:nucleotidyltransferase/DNA polymerase involved in DNA repair
MQVRKIVHTEMDTFYASVEQRDVVTKRNADTHIMMHLIANGAVHCEGFGGGSSGCSAGGS